MLLWFVGLVMDDRIWDHSTFSKNRDRLMASEIDELLFIAIKKQAYSKRLLSRDHFTSRRHIAGSQRLAQGIQTQGQEQA
jgi:transposase